MPSRWRRPLPALLTGLLGLGLMLLARILVLAVAISGLSIFGARQPGLPGWPLLLALTVLLVTAAGALPALALGARPLLALLAGLSGCLAAALLFVGRSEYSFDPAETSAFIAPAVVGVVVATAGRGRPFRAVAPAAAGLLLMLAAHLLPAAGFPLALFAWLLLPVLGALPGPQRSP